VDLSIALILAGLARLTLGPEHRVGWITVAALTLLMLLSQTLDLLSGTFGSKYFGASYPELRSLL